jgi:RNA polymerase sigma factor (sigma-70 family)
VDSHDHAVGSDPDSLSDSRTERLGREKEIFRHFLEGNRRACRQVERWASEIVYFKGFGIPHHSHADIVQDALADTLVVAAREEIRNPRALVRQVALRHCYRWYRRARKQRELKDKLQHGWIAPPNPPEPPDRGALIGQLIHFLPPLCRNLFFLYFWVGLSYRQIGRSLDMPKANVAYHMVKCLREAKRRLGDK